jgi:hypothetical protein
MARNVMLIWWSKIYARRGKVQCSEQAKLVFPNGEECDVVISWSKIHEQMGKVPARLFALQHSSQYLKEGMLRKLDENCVLRVLHEYAWRVAIPLREWG